MWQLVIAKPQRGEASDPPARFIVPARYVAAPADSEGPELVARKEPSDDETL